MNKIVIVLIISVLAILTAGPAEANPASGFILYSPMSDTNTYLIDRNGEVWHTWPSTLTPGLSPYLLEDGSIIRPGVVNSPHFPVGQGGRIQRIAWNGTLLWDYRFESPKAIQHHDIAVLPNGNVLFVAWERKTPAEAIAAGRDPATLSDGWLYSERIVEVAPNGLTGGTVVWEWHLWDHLVQHFDPAMDNYGVVAYHPELLDINSILNTGADWIHTNGLDYNAELDQILISGRNMHEIYVIDHSTTITEAVGHSGGTSGMGGDILYRWGNPQVYGAGSALNQKFFTFHDAHWIPEGRPGSGNILVFNNGNSRPGGSWSSTDEISPPVNGSGHYWLPTGSPFGPIKHTWVYSDPGSFHASHLSGMVRLSDGNTLICDGPRGRFFEVNQAGQTVWEFVNPYPDPQANNVFKIRHYGAGYPGLSRLFTFGGKR